MEAHPQSGAPIVRKIGFERELRRFRCRVLAPPPAGAAGGGDELSILRMPDDAKAARARLASGVTLLAGETFEGTERLTARAPDAQRGGRDASPAGAPPPPPPQRFVNLVGGGWVHELDPATRRPLIEYLD